ncbi:Amino-acid acetyltransferase, mitochondrial [Xylographa soralifera]|nr:Amino-acid acetyltransferase, mitochondrial [Xylographa soralifera]
MNVHGVAIIRRSGLSKIAVSFSKSSRSLPILISIYSSIVVTVIATHRSGTVRLVDAIPFPTKGDLPLQDHTGRGVPNKYSERNFFLDVLSSTSGKREAKAYLSRFKPPSPQSNNRLTSEHKKIRIIEKDHISGVNLGGLFLPARAVDESPVFSQDAAPRTFVDISSEPLHVALVSVKSPQLIDNQTLQGIGLTLSQLAKLGLGCIVVVDLQDEQRQEISSEQPLLWRTNAIEQADRIVSAIERQSGQGARRLDSVIGISAMKVDFTPIVKVRGDVRILHRNLLLAPLRRGVVPVVVPVGYTSLDQKAVAVSANDVMLALTRELAGIVRRFTPEEEPAQLMQSIRTAQREISLDRIIILDQLGGIPSTSSMRESHIFINLEQEYEGIRDELLRLKDSHKTKTQVEVAHRASTLSTSKISNIVSEFVDGETDRLPSINLSIDNHLNSLQLVRDALAILPPSSSALLTTPQEAANSSGHSSLSKMPGVGTRPFRNPLIHNLLTDKPIFSSSLPRTRLSSSTNSTQNPSTPATFIKRGMSLTFLPDPRIEAWKPPTPLSLPLQLSDARIDLTRLVHLIEDSFGRLLDVQRYMARISQNLAGIIIAGSYEGAAILTWEVPPNLPSSVIPGTPAYAARMVPYLDKFAVLKRSQGAGGVADIVFSAMVRDCFPKGVVWRSRRDNPVNKWYFERAKGTWKIPVKEQGAQGWTMFWTTEDVDGDRFDDYKGVCRSVETSWADGKKLLD